MSKKRNAWEFAGIRLVTLIRTLEKEASKNFRTFDVYETSKRI